nr:G-protein beta WD-40 repeats containing protein [Cryptomonas curvata]
MKCYLSFFSGKLIFFNLQKVAPPICYDLILDSKGCSGNIAPIINIDNRLILVGIEKKFIKIFSNKNQKNIFNTKCPDKKFNHLFSIQSLPFLFFSSYKNYIYIWKRKNERNWKIIHKIISKNNINFISNILKSNLIITTDINNFGILLWKIFENKLFFCGKAIIKEKIVGIDGSPYNELFIIRNGKGILKTYTSNGFIINNLFEKKKTGHSMDIFIQNSLKFCDSNTFLTGGTSKNLSLWDLRTNEIVQQWKGHIGEIKEIDTNLSIFNSGKFLTISRDNYGIIKTWDLRMSGELHSFKIYSRKISCMKLV